MSKVDWLFPFHMLHEACYYDGASSERLQKLVWNQYPQEAQAKLELGPRIRVELLPNEYTVYDFTDPVYLYFKKLPPWMEESMALLLLVESGTEVDGIGYRYNGTVFYLERRGLM